MCHDEVDRLVNAVGDMKEVVRLLLNRNTKRLQTGLAPVYLLAAKTYCGGHHAI